MHFEVPIAGAVLNTLNIRHDAHTKSFILRRSEAKVVFVHYQFLEVTKATVRILSQVKKELPLTIVIHELDNYRTSLNDNHEGVLDHEKLLANRDPNFETR